MSLRVEEIPSDSGRRPSGTELGRESIEIEAWEHRISSKYALELTRLSALSDYKMVLGLRNLFNQIFEDRPVPFSMTESEEILTTLTFQSFDEHKKVLEKFKLGGSWYNHFHSYTNQSRQAPHHDPVNEQVKHEHLLKHWADEYRGNALDALWERLRQDQSWLNGSTDDYSKCINIAQSSGIGKTRLLHELGRRMLGITFVFRTGTEPGFPSQDAAIYNYLVSAKDLPEGNSQAKTLGLFAGTLATFSKYIKQAVADKKTFAQFLQGWGTLTDHVEYSGITHSMNASGIPETLPARRKILEQIVQEAEKAEKLVYKDPEMKPYLETSDFRNTTQPEFERWYTTDQRMRNILLNKLQEADDLLKALPGIESDTMSSSMMFIAFADSANLIGSKFKAGGEPRRQSELYSTFRRVYTITKDFPLWGFFSSTNSRLDVFDSAAAEDGSSRLSTELECLRDPFLSFPVNLESNRLLTSPETREAELRAPISSFSEASHMAKFGRPLWQSYKELMYDDLIRLVKVKMFGGGQRATFNIANRLHVFTVCASRICLDLGINDSSTTFSQDAVSANLRIVTRLEPGTGLIRTITPSEPLVAEAATSVLMGSTSLLYGTVKTKIWEPCLQFLINHLFRGGLVDKGTHGEILARVILLLARDRLFSHRATKSCQMRFSQPFTVKDFMTSLFGTDSANIVFDAGTPAMMEAKTKHPRSSTKKALEIGTGWMNFTHFTSTNKDLQTHMFPDLLYHLFRQNAALQLSLNQPDYDVLLPVYVGDINQPIDSTKLTGIMVQVKNRITPEAVKFCPRIHDLLPNPKIYLQLELGYGKTVPEDRKPVKAWLETDKKVLGNDEIAPAVIVAVAYGVYQTTFPLMKEGMLESTCRELLRELSSEGRVQGTKEAAILESLESYKWPLGLLNSASRDSAG